MASAGKSQLLSFMDELIPTIRTALCDRFVLFLCFLEFSSGDFFFKKKKKIASVNDKCSKISFFIFLLISY